MTDKQPSADSHIVTRGAGLAFLGRMGALFEPVSVVVFAQLYGAPNLGLFLLLWGYVQLVVAATDLATSVALQRFIPSTKDEDKVHAILKASILVSIVLSVIASLALTLAAPWLATHINAEEGVSGDLSLIIATYAWAIPIWCLVEVTTAAMRARRAFGPEVRIRVLYEQGLRLISGVTFFLMGMPIYGLFLSHLLAITVTLVASFYNLRRYYDLRRAWAAPLKAAGLRELVRFGLPMVGTASLKKFQSNFPIFLLNFIIPGAQGATAVAVYSVARKVSSALQGIRMSFDYVIAPLAASKNPLSERDALQDMFTFTTRLMVSIFIPATAVMLILSRDILMVVGSEFAAASGLLVALALGRAVEAAVGPSASLVEMLARYRLPLINNATGFAVTALLMLLLVPGLGAMGAAISSAIGLSVTALMALGEAWMLYGLKPYDRRIFRPLGTALLGGGVIIALVKIAEPYGMAPRIAAAAIGLLIAFYFLLRFGYSNRDAAAFGKFARWLRN